MKDLRVLIRQIIEEIRLDQYVIEHGIKNGFHEIRIADSLNKLRPLLRMRQKYIKRKK